MQSVFNSVKRAIIPTRLKIPLFNLSTTVTTKESNSNQLLNVEEEPDKLYKTVQIEMRAYEPATMISYHKFAMMAADHLGIRVGECWAPNRPKHFRLTLLRSRHVHKKHRVQYEVRTYFRFMTFHYMTGSTADTFLEYLERMLPEGIALKITKVALEKLPEDVFHPPVLPEIENSKSESIT